LRYLAILIAAMFLCPVGLHAQAVLTGTVTVAADANDDDGDAATVDSGVNSMTFMFDGMFIGDSPPPAPAGQWSGSIAWDTLAHPNGPGSLTAEACDVAGNCGLSSAVSVDIQNVDLLPPSVTITSP
jgi:hypothetical protein